MQITRKSDYAISCILHMSKEPEKLFVIDKLAEPLSIPKSFLSKILHQLSLAGIIKSIRGVKGGYQLLKRPEEISLYDVIEATEGPIALNRCVINKKMCTLSDRCSVYPVWVKIRQDIQRQLKEHNFADLLLRKDQRRYQ